MIDAFEQTASKARGQRWPWQADKRIDGSNPQPMEFGYRFDIESKRFDRQVPERFPSRSRGDPFDAWILLEASGQGRLVALDLKHPGAYLFAEGIIGNRPSLAKAIGDPDAAESALCGEPALEFLGQGHFATVPAFESGDIDEDRLGLKDRASCPEGLVDRFDPDEWAKLHQPFGQRVDFF